MLDSLQVWAQESIRDRLASTAQALDAFCKKPRSVKRLHRSRRELARLRAVLADLGEPAGVAPELIERVRTLHRRAGNVRDADVLLGRIADYRKGASRRERKQLKRLKRVMRKRRKRARRKFERAARAFRELRT